MKTSLLMFALLLVSLIYVSCGDDEPKTDDSQTEYTEKELSLHGGNQRYWKLKGDLYNGIDLMQSYGECEKDNIYLFDIHGNYNIDAGATKCATNPEPDLVRGYYELDEAKNTLLLSFGDTIFTANIMELSAEVLTWQRVVQGDTIQKSYKVQ